MGGFMKINGFGLSRGAILGTSLLAFALPWLSASAQTPDAQALTAAQAPVVPARVTQTVDDGNRMTLHGNVHPMAQPQFDRGPVADSEPASRMSLLLQRSPDQETALRQLLQQQQDKTSPNYHKWLTPDQFGKQYGPADTDIQAVTDWLTSQGFTGIKVSAGRTTIEFSGNVGQVRNAFQTEIHHFFVNDKMHVANVSDPQIPAALAPVVAGVLTLHDFRPKAQVHQLGTFRKTKATGEVTPLFTYAGCGSKSTVPCYAVGPGDFQKIYNVPYVPGTSDGAGVTIAIVQDSNINVADVTSFRSLFGLPANFSTSNIILNGPDPGIQGPNNPNGNGDEVEADLDVQWAGAVAPGATIDLVVSQDSDTIGTAGIDLSAIYIINNNIAPIMSESFGDCEAGLGTSGEDFYVQLWQQASAQGITVILAAGDSGSAACDPSSTASNQDVAASGLAVSGLASTGYNVAMGGTDFQNGTVPSPFWNTTNATSGTLTQISAKSYIPESTWNDSCSAPATAGNVALNTCTAATINANNNPSALTFGNDLVAGSGGPSSITSGGSPINPIPIWQTGTTGISATETFRVLPDISFFAGNGLNGSFYIICQQDANTGTGSSTSSCDLNSPFNDFQGVGGTSAAAPSFAGVMALVNQKTGQRQGNANFVLYQLYKKNTAGTICTSNTAAVTATGCIFYDTVTGNNSVACQGGTPNCSNTSTAANQFGIIVDPAHPTNPAWVTTPNYDLATGLGSLNVGNLINAWGSASFTPDTVTITSPASGTVNIKHGTAVTFNVTVSSASATGSVSLVATPTGNPQLGIGSFSENTSTTLSGGTATINTTQLPGGTAYPVVASYSGDGTFAAGTSAPVTVTVTPESSSTAVSVWTSDANGNVLSKNATTAPYGSNYVLQIAVSDSSGNQCATIVAACPTGTVTLTDNGGPLKDFSGTNTTKLNSLGFAEDQPVQLGGGPHSLVAAYSGDNSFTASTSPADSFTITTAPTTTTASSGGVASVPVGQAVTLTAAIATGSNGAGPTGTVTFTAGGKTIGTGTVTGTAAVFTGTGTPASGTASASVTFAAAGAQSVTAAYSGDGNYAPSTSVAITLTVTSGTQATTTVVTASATSIASGGSITFTAKVTGTTNNAAGPTGTVQFMNGTTALGTAATCMPTAGTASTPGTCTATLMTTLALLTPPVAPANRIRNLPVGPMWFVCGLLLAAFMLSLLYPRLAPWTRRLGYACAGALLLACVVAGIAGCGGGGSSSGGGGGGTTPHSDSITGVYSGDGTYAASTSATVTISIQ
jgi:Pro-kumamolisin, activation domain/Bacterial Ig-like domain (group 3)